MAVNVDAWLARAKTVTESRMPNNQDSGEALQFAVSMATALYGAESQQLQMLKKRAEAIAKEKGNFYPFVMVHQFAVGAIRNMVAEIEAGLVSSVRLGLTGEILGDLVGIAREMLGAGSLPAAYVLTAAAYEDTLRRLAQEKAGLVDRIKLEQVIGRLKDAGVLQGGEPSVVQSFLKFRNDSLHADWSNVTSTQAESCLALVDSLIIKHFS